MASAKKDLYSRQSAWRERNPWSRAVEFARRRCTDKTHKSYASHGAKGIKVNLTAVEAGVLWARDGASNMEKPSLDRINPRKNYTFKNCRFIEFDLNALRPHVPAWVTDPIPMGPVLGYEIGGAL